MTPLIAAEGLVAGYGGLDIIRGVDLEVREGEVVALLGPNGAGKSTLTKALFGLVKVRSGRVTFAGSDITGWPAHRSTAAGLGYVPQVGNVFPNLTVEENLAMGAFLRVSGIDDAKGRALDLFPDLRERLADKVGRLSGGQRQMVAIARALMLEPKALVLDEPSAGLAPQLQSVMFDRIRGIADAGTSVLLAEQNARRALKLCDRAYVLEQGHNRFQGSGADLLADPNIGRLYLGGA